MKTLAIKGAFGRDYKSWQTFLADWEAGKDFYCYESGYLNKDSIRYLREMGITKLECRYNNERQVNFINVPEAQND